MSNSRPVANRKSWKALDPPDLRAELDLVATYTHGDFELIKLGVIPEEMEDKWFIFFEEPWLYFHRSWTGSVVYGVEFRSDAEKVSIVASWAGLDGNQEVDRDHHRDLLKFLIDALLLGKAVSFPLPKNLPPGAPKGLYQHHVAGSAFPEAESPQAAPRAGPMPAAERGWWDRLFRLISRRGK
jgi:hypothetical protein